MRVFLCCNDLTGRSTGYLISVYVEDLAFLKGEPLECSYDDFNYYTIGLRYKFFFNHRQLNSDKRWDELIMPTRYIAKLLRLLKKKGWEGDMDYMNLDFYPFWRVENGEGITTDVINEFWVNKIKENMSKNVYKTTNTGRT
jgi:hypothetical protein